MSEEMDRRKPPWTWGRKDLPSLPPEDHVIVHLRLVGAGVDYPVPFPRVPVEGERISGPDGMVPYRVSRIDWRFDDGFNYAPRPMVIAKVW